MIPCCLFLLFVQRACEALNVLHSIVDLCLDVKRKQFSFEVLFTFHAQDRYVC